MSAIEWATLPAAIVIGFIALWASRRGYIWLYNIGRLLAHILSGGATLGHLGSLDPPKKGDKDK